MSNSDKERGPPDNPHSPPGHVTIFFDYGDPGGQLRKETVHPGEWQVRKLKELFGVDDAKVLAEITATGLNDLDDDGHIRVHDGQKFMAHARGGGAS